MPAISDAIPTPQNDGSNASNSSSSSPPSWIGFIVFGLFVVITAMFFYALLRRQARGRRRIDRTAMAHRDLSWPARYFESSIRVHHPRPPRQSFDFVELGQPYTRLRDDGVKILPDQSGQSVECVICLEPFQDDSMVRALPCRHLFHSRCIANWFQKHHDTCPICMTHYTSNDLRQAEASLPAQPPRAILAS